MRHNRRTQRLGRTWSERRALFKSLVTSLIIHQEIVTTLPKAKEAKRLADRVITLGKKDTLASRRQVFAYLQDHVLTSRIFKEVAPRFKKRNGGYTRILQLSRRKGDGAQLALLELTEKEIKIKEIKKPTKKNLKDQKGQISESQHEPNEGEGHPKAQGPIEKEKHAPKGPDKEIKPKFFKSLGKFFRNKGFGNKGG